MNKKILSAVIFLILSFPLAGEFEKYPLVRIIDGDTIVVEFQGKNERVRLIGIDTPESARNRKAERDAERSGVDVEVIVEQGRRSTAFAQKLLSRGNYVALEFDVGQRDRFGRLLAYVYLPDGRMLNEVMVREGYATVMTVPPNVKYKDLFLKAYREAREQGRGLWAE